MPCKSIVRLAQCAAIVAVGWVVCTANGESSPPKDAMRMEVVDTDSGPAIRVSVGDMLFTASQMTFTLGDGQECTVRSAQRQIELAKGGTLIISARRLEVPLRGGMLAHRAAAPARNE